MSSWSDKTSTDRMFCLMCDFLSELIRSKKVFDTILPHLPSILSSFVYPRLCFSAEDEERWSDDPMEYVRSMLDPFEDFYSPATNAASLFIDVCKSRKKHAFPIVLQLISNIMGAQVTNEQDFKRRDGCFFLVGSLAKILLKNGMEGPVEDLIVHHILPTLTASSAIATPGYLKVRALWTIQQFSSLNYKKQDTVMSLLRAIIEALQDKANLPVQVQSACCLGELLDQQAIQQALPQVLAPVVETILQLNSACENDSLAMVLEKLVSMYADELAPFAVQLCTSLRDTAVRISQQATIDPDSGFADFEENGPMMALAGMVRTIITLVDSMSDSPQLLVSLEEIVCPFLVFIIEHRLRDVYDEVFELIESFTYLRKTVSPTVWQLIDHVVFGLVAQTDTDYADELSIVIDNAATYDAVTFSSKQRLQAVVLECVKKVMVETDDDEYTYSTQVESVLAMMESWLLNAVNDEVTRLFVELVMSKIVNEASPLTDNTAVLHLEIVLAALISNTRYTLNVLSASQSAHVFLSKLSLLSARFVRVHDKQLIIAALSSILDKIPFMELPSQIQQHFSSLVTVYAEAIETLPKAMEERKKLREDANRDDDQDDEDFDFDSDDYEDLDALEEVRRKGGSSSPVDEDEEGSSLDLDNLDEEEDDESWEEDALEENIYFESNLDKVDMAAVVQASLSGFARSQPSVLQSVMPTLTPEHAKLIMSIVQ
jgi:hypothetical protein